MSNDTEEYEAYAILTVHSCHEFSEVRSPPGFVPFPVPCS